MRAPDIACRVDGGKPEAGTEGVQPEWFYKGDGAILAAQGEPFTMPSFALDGGGEVLVIRLRAR